MKISKARLKQMAGFGIRIVLFPIGCVVGLAVAVAVVVYWFQYWMFDLIDSLMDQR